MFELDANPKALLRDVLQLYLHAKRVVIILRSDSDPRFLDAVSSSWQFFRTCVLEYSVPGYIGRQLGGMEIAYCFVEPIKSRPGRRVIPGLAPKAQPGGVNQNHPCARNIDHMRWLVDYFSEPWETVVDPFMGSGTTGVAAANLGRKFAGVEIVKSYYQEAVRCVSEAQAQQSLFGKEEIKWEQVEIPLSVAVTAGRKKSSSRTRINTKKINK